jgi:uncharacterized repeat protein (TIGR01451 family)
MKLSKTRLSVLIGLVGLLLAGFALQAGSTPGASVSKNKVIIYPSGSETISQLRQQGITNVDNYGSYWVAEVGDQDVTKLKATHGDRAVLANHLYKIELSTGPIDVRAGESAVPASMRQSATTGMRLRLVQFKGPVQPDWLDQVKAAGKVKIVSYIPNNAYVVHVDDAAEKNLAKLTGTSGPIQWIGPYHPYYKVRTSLRNSTAPTVKVDVAVVRGPDTDQTLQNIKRYNLTPMGEPTTTRNQVVAEIEVSPKDLPQIAQMPDVLWISQVFPTKNMDEQQTLTLTFSEAGPEPSSYVDFLAGLGFSTDQTTYPILDIADTGLDEPNPNCNDQNCTPPNFVPFVTTFHPAFYESPLTIADVSGCVIPLSRVAYRDSVDTDGHGTVVASIAAGLDTLPDEFVNCITMVSTNFQIINIDGSTNTITCAAATNVASPPFPDDVVRRVSGLQAGLGVSPYGPIGSSTEPASGEDFSHAQSIYLRNARISNNSWGQDIALDNPPDNAGAYDARSQNYDMLTRDSLNTGSTNTPGSSPQNQEVIWVFAVNNVSTPPIQGGLSDIGGIPDVTVTPPSTAKNVISVGATTKGEPEQIAAFTAFGPTEDGRFKPEIVAPGNAIFGAVSQATYTQPLCGGCDPSNPVPPACSNDFHLVGTITELYGPASGVHLLNYGTSFSAPAVSGGIQLLWWWFQNKFSMLQPSPAMAKAYLCNSARYIPLTNSLTGTGDRLPSIAQGMGRMDLTRMFDGTPRVLRDETTPRAIDNALLATNPVLQQTFFSRSGQSYEVSGVVASNDAPFRVTLAWTDAPGDPAAFQQLVNDLDLEVTIGGQTYKGNVFGTQYSTVDPSRGADTVNNMESVFLPVGTTGTWSIVIRASNIAGDGVPNIKNSAVGQDFALVVYNSGNDAFGGPNAPSDASNLATNNSCQTAASIAQFPYTFTNSLSSAVYGNVQPSPSAARGGSDEFFKIPLPTPGVTFTVDTFGSGFDTVLSVWSGNCGVLSEVVSTNDVIHGSQVSFTADGSNDYYIVVEPHNDGPGGQMILDVNATQTPISVTPTNLAFGIQVEGTTSAVQTVIYQNSATVSVDILSNPTITGPNATNFPIISQNCGFDTVQTGATCFVLIAFTPATIGTNQANLVFTDNATGSPRSIPLTGIGTPVAPLVCMSSGGPFVFPDQLLTTTSAVQSITITNCGSAALNITNLTITGSGSNDFIVTQDCTSGTPIAPGAICAINVAFAPQATGTRQATLTMTDDAAGGPTTLLLQGDGIPLTPALCFGNNPINFSTVFVSSTSSVQSVIITNCGRAPLVIGSVTLAGTNAGDFVINSSTCATVTPGNTCAIVVTFAPTATGIRTAVLTIGDNTAGNPDQVSLTGIGSGINCFTPITITPTGLPTPTVGIPYNQSLTGNGVKAPATFFLAIGPMPPGLSLSTSGVISGMPTKIGQFTFEVGLTDANGCSAAQLYTVFVSCPTISILPNPLPSGTEFVTYNPQTFTASGGTPPYTFLQTAGALPAGMTISSNGVLSGTPSSPSSTFTVMATDSNNCTATKVYTLTLVDPTPPIAITPTNLVAGVVGVNYNQTLVASGSSGPYSFTNNAGSFPPGLSLSPSGVLSGVPTAAGSYSFAVTVTGSATNAQSICTINITSAANLAISSSFSPSPVTIGSNLTCSITVTNLGPSPATGVTVSNSLPTGAGFVSASTGCVMVGGTLVCNVGSLAAGASIPLSYIVTNTTLGLASATATVSANETDPSAGNNSAVADSIVVPVPPPFTVAINPKAITDVEGDGTNTVSVTLKGAGTMEVHLLGGSEAGPIDSIVLTNTDATSSLTIQVKRGKGSVNDFVNIGSIVGNGGLKTISGKGVNVTGAGVQLGGSLGTININALANSALAVSGSIKNVTVQTFTASIITAAEIGSVKISTITTTNNGGQEFGVLVQQAGKGTVSVSNPKLKWKIATSPDQSMGDFHVKQ